MGNSSSSIQKQAEDIEGAIEALGKINTALANYRLNVYKSEFSEELPKPNDPDLVTSKKYSFMSYKKDIAWDSIKNTVDSVIEIPSVLSNKRKAINDAVTNLTSMVVGQQESFAFSKAFTWRVTGNDNNEYLYAVVCAATAIDSSKWGISKGISCQAAMTFVFRAGSKIRANPSHNVNDPPQKEKTETIVNRQGQL